MMKLKTHGTNTLNTEVTNISNHGFWLINEETEYFLAYTDFPWFKDAPVSRIFNVEEPTEHHFYWPDLDVDLSLEIIKYPGNFPLQSKIQHTLQK